MGWPQVGDLAHQAVLRRKAALFALIQCLEAAVPVVLRAALQWDRYAEGQAVIRGTDGLESRGGEQRESQSIALPLSLGEEAPIGCRWTCPRCLVEVHLPTPALFIPGMTEVKR